MAIKAVLKDSGTGKAYVSFKTAFGRLFGVTTYQKEKSVFKSVIWAAAVSETVLVSALGDGSIEVTDILVSAEKKNGGSLLVHFDDGTNEVTLLKASVDDSAYNIAAHFQGKLQGWQGANLYYTVVGTYTGSITIVYIHHNKENSMTYGDWDAGR